MSRRVVISGLGPVTAFGMGIAPLWEAMIEGRSAIRRVARFRPDGFESTAAAEIGPGLLDIRALVPRSYRKATKVMCRDIEIAVAAAAEAVRDAGLVTKAAETDAPPTIPPQRMGCHIGAGLIAAEVDELGAALWCSRDADGAFDIRDWGRRGMENLTPLWLLKYLPNMLACHVTIIHDCQGPSNTITCCEASSGLSIGESMRVIQRGAADACLSGGAESKTNLMGFLRQHFAERVADTSGLEDPASIVRPFDPCASGTVLGEGGGIVVVEAADSAEARGAAPYAEIAGFASTQSLGPDRPPGESSDDVGAIADAITLCLEQSGQEEIDAIVPLGSSIPRADRAEAAAIRRVFGERASRIPIVTTVPNVGNCCAGAGGVAVSVAARALREQRLPARLNTAASDGLDAVACPSRPAALRRVLVCATSQGGQNVAMVLQRP
jgi:3-oxoacyl-[acyl-carrier-protein] synthase II